jgi:hypothetical protein
MRARNARNNHKSTFGGKMLDKNDKSDQTRKQMRPTSALKGVSVAANNELPPQLSEMELNHGC